MVLIHSHITLSVLTAVRLVSLGDWFSMTSPTWAQRHCPCQTSGILAALSNASQHQAGAELTRRFLAKTMHHE
jgi:hypothetical protein